MTARKKKAAKKKTAKKKPATRKSGKKTPARKKASAKAAGSARFYDPDYLDEGELSLAGVQRAVLFALVELRPDESIELAAGEHLLTHPRRDEFLLTSRIFLFDVIFDDGSNRSLLAGYVGGGSFQRLHFADGRVLLDFARGMSLGDQESVRGAELDDTREATFHRLFNSENMLEYWVNDPPDSLPPMATPNHTAGVLRISDPAFLKQDKRDADLGVLYKAWTASDFDPKAAKGDEERFSRMVGLAGLLVSISDESRSGNFEPISPAPGGISAAAGDPEAASEATIQAALAVLGACPSAEQGRLCEHLQADLGDYSLGLRWSITQLRSAHVLLTEESSGDEEDYLLFFDQGEAFATLSAQECATAASCLDAEHWANPESSQLPASHTYMREIAGLPSLPGGLSPDLEADSEMTAVAVYDAQGELQSEFYDLGEGYEQDCYVRCGNGLARLSVTAEDGRQVDATPRTVVFEGMRRFLGWRARQGR